MSVIKSIQNVTITIAASATSGTATISAVTNANTVIDWSGWTMANTSTWSSTTDLANVTLSGTTLTATRNTSSSFALVVYVCVTEYLSSAINSSQAGSIVLNTTGTTNTATITAVTLANTAVIYNGQTSANASSSSQVIWADVSATSTTAITGHRDTGSGTIATTVYFNVLEFKASVLNSNTQQIVNSFTGATSTSTITAVTMAQAGLYWGGQTDTSSGSALNGIINAQLTATTTISWAKLNGTFTTEGVVTVVEYKSSDIKSLNRGTNVIATSTSSKSTTITAVNTSYCAVHQLGSTIGASGAVPADHFVASTLASGTSVNSLRVSSSASTAETVSWEAIEFQPPSGFFLNANTNYTNGNLEELAGGTGRF